MIENKFKKITVILFIIFIFLIPIINIISKDKKINEIENKILTQFKAPTYNSIIDKSFMKNFEKYVEDQFPNRETFISLKNNYSYLIGQREFRNIFVTKDNRLLEKYIFSKENIGYNLNKIVEINKTLESKNIKSKLVIIPNSIDFYKDKSNKFLLNDSQKNTLDYINNFSKKII